MAYWRLSGFYLFFFASLGVLVPYWTLYLQDQGFSAAEIGEIMAVFMATKIIAPNVWGWVADHSGRRGWVVRTCTLFALVVFAAVFWASGYWWIMAVMCGFSIFWHAVLPQFEAMTMSHLGDQVHRYSMIRLWGSVGFIISVVSLGYLLDRVGPASIPWAVVLMLLGLWLLSLSVPRDKEARPAADQGTIWRVIRRPDVVAFLLICFLLQAGHGPYYTFYTIYLESYDYSSTLIGGLWALGVVAEIGIFLVMHRLLPRYGVRLLMIVSLLLTTLRWLLIAWGVEWLPVLLFAQLLHAASFGLFHAVAIHMIHHFFTGRHQGRGQALYSSVSFGAGGALGSLISGYMWSDAGAGLTYSVAALFSFAAALLAIKYVKPVIDEKRH